MNKNRNNNQVRPEKKDIQNNTSKNTLKFKFQFEVIDSSSNNETKTLQEYSKREWKGEGEITAEALSSFVAEFVGHTAKNFVESHTTHNEDNDFDDVK